jgi:hypothetical protein
LLAGAQKKNTFAKTKQRQNICGETKRKTRKKKKYICKGKNAANTKNWVQRKVVLAIEKKKQFTKKE